MIASCRLCEASSPRVGERALLGKRVSYFQCPACDLLFCETPYWLEEAYAAALSHLDTGAVERNQIAAQLTLLVATTVGLPATATAIDFGGGHGVFTRMMRDLGLDFRWADLRAENLFARGFEGSVDEHHALVTAFEVLEHLVDVGTELTRLFAPQPDFVFVGTTLHHGYDADWWYLLPETGQHVAFYSVATMRAIGDRFGYDVFAGPEYTLFVRQGVELGSARRALLRGLIARPGAALAAVDLIPQRLLRRLTPYRSRLQSDFDRLRRAL